MTDSAAEDPGTVTILLRSGGQIVGAEVIEVEDGESYSVVRSHDGNVTMIPTDNIAAVVFTGELASVFRQHIEVRR